MTNPCSKLMRWLVVLGLLALACGNKKAVPGGPKDTTPPEIVDIVPLHGEEKVNPFDPIQITFSEPVDKSSAEKLIRLTPFTRWKADWDGEILLLKIEDGLSPDTVYDLHVSGSISDRDNNKADMAEYHIFTTADTLPKKQISGFVDHLTADVSRAKVELFSVDPLYPDSLPAKPIRQGTAGKTGAFVLDFVQPGSYVIMAYVDQNSDWRQQTSSEAGAQSSVLSIAPTGDPVDDLYLLLKKPGDPGAIQGQIACEDSLRKYPTILHAFLMQDEIDTLATHIKTEAEYDWLNIPAGPYLVTGFLDVDRDHHLSDSLEVRFTYPDTVWVDEGRRTKGVNLKLNIRK